VGSVYVVRGKRVVVRGREEGGAGGRAARPRLLRWGLGMPSGARYCRPPSLPPVAGSRRPTRAAGSRAAAGEWQPSPDALGCVPRVQPPRRTYRLAAVAGTQWPLVQVMHL